MVRISNVCTADSGFPLFKDFSLKISTGDHCIIEGANGSGKTSLLKLIAGKLILSRGSVAYDFINPSLNWDQQFKKRSQFIHFIPVQALHDVLGNQGDLFYQQRYYSMTGETLATVRDYFGGDIEGLDALGLPDSFNVQGLLPVELVKLSNGQIKKILIIKQLLKGLPKLLLLDFPFEGLDRLSRIELCQFLDHLAKDFSIQLIITDHHHLLPTVINRRIVLNDFEVVRDERFQPSNSESPRRPKTKIADVHGLPVIEMKDVSVRYGMKTVIADFNWKVHKGERWALTGRNGSGKTTLFSLIYADHPLAYSQQVFLFGKRRGSGESIWDIKKRMNYLGPEQLHFLSMRNPLKNGQNFLEELAPAMATLSIATVVDHFGARDLLSKPIGKLSSGEVQLLHLVLFFLSQKELLLLDEPFQFLDPENKRRVSDYLQNYLNPDSTLILITHYEDDIVDWTELRKEV